MHNSNLRSKRQESCHSARSEAQSLQSMRRIFIHRRMDCSDFARNDGGYFCSLEMEIE